MRARMFLLSTAMLTAGLASPASAAPPELIGPGLSDPLRLCGTTIGFTQEVVRVRVHKDGRTTGTIKIRLTNEATGKNVLVNASGPATFRETVLQNGNIEIVFAPTGPGLYYPFPGEEEYYAAANLPDLFVTKGPFKQTIVLDVTNADEDTPPGVVSFLTEVPNRIENLCTVLT